MSEHYEAWTAFGEDMSLRREALGLDDETLSRALDGPAEATAAVDAAMEDLAAEIPEVAALLDWHADERFALPDLSRLDELGPDLLLPGPTLPMDVIIDLRGRVQQPFPKGEAAIAALYLHCFAAAIAPR